MGAFKEQCIETVIDENPEDLRVIGLIEMLVASKSLDTCDQPHQLHLIPDSTDLTCCPNNSCYPNAPN